MRDEKGRFIKGSRPLPGVGRKPVASEHKYRAALEKAFDENTITEIGEKIKTEILESKNIPVALTRLLFQYIVPEPTKHRILEIISDDRAIGELTNLLENLARKDMDAGQFLYTLNKQLQNKNDEPIQ